MICHFILYVSDQRQSTEFWEKALDQTPILDVPGMTEFKLGEGCILGLMPSKGIVRLLGNSIQDPEKAGKIPKAEVYLRVKNPEEHLKRSIDAGARLLSPFEERNWGATAGYVEDPDGHVVAFST